MANECYTKFPESSHLAVHNVSHALPFIWLRCLHGGIKSGKKSASHTVVFFHYFLTQKNSEEWRKFSIKNIDFSRPLTQSCNLSYTHYLSNYFSISSPLWFVVHICRRIIESCNLDRKKASRAMRKSCLGNACEVGTGTMHCSCLHPICRAAETLVLFIFRTWFVYFWQLWHHNSFQFPSWFTSF